MTMIEFVMLHSAFYPHISLFHLQWISIRKPVVGRPHEFVLKFYDTYRKKLKVLQ